jgi:TonB family protein
MAFAFLALAMASSTAPTEKLAAPMVVRTPITYAPAPPAVFPPLVREGEGPAVPKGNPGNWANSFDYPSAALREEREGITAFNLTIGTSGLVTACTVTSSSGHSDLDMATCNNVKRRARFYPAQDAAGKPIEGSYANRVAWRIPSDPSYITPLPYQSFPKSPTIIDWSATQLRPDQYPAEAIAAREQGDVTVKLDVDKAGRVVTCMVSNSSKSKSLDARSCEIAEKWTFYPGLDANGETTESQLGYSFNWNLPKKAAATGGDVAAVPVYATRPRPAFNPFEKAGSMTMTASFDAEGKLMNCDVKHTGDLDMFTGQRANGPDMCKSGIAREAIVPYRDENGTPQSRNIILKFSLEHEAPDAKKAGDN